ncbi:hypothetical protein CFC21_018479, partial [Triticum aestivum]
AIG